ncbi:MAG: hypothetical protein MI922_15265, partial [Bacteroidales bacterium]|nr:hypothetical protein [Bacteroidales bacterium]
EWVKDSTGIIPEKYARMVADYLVYFESKGFVFDVLGIDNEDAYNEGQMTANPWRHKETIDHLRVLAEERGFHLPLIIGPEDYGPKPHWMQEMVQKGWGDRVDIVGTHYYPRWRPMAKLKDMLQYAGDRPIWHSEVHWDNMDDTDVITEAELALATIFDCFDVGFTGMAWWAYTRSGIKGDIEKTLVRSTVGHRPIEVVDFDGATAKTGKVITRAFRAGDHITLWLTNNTDRTYANMEITLPDERLAGRIDYVFWTPESTYRSSTIPNANGGLTITIRPRTVYCIEMTWSLPQPVGHYRFDGDYVDSGSAAADGRAYGVVDFSEGKIEQAATLVSDYGEIVLPHVQTEDMSISLWINTATSGVLAEQWDEGTVLLSSDTKVSSRHLGISLMEGRVAFVLHSPERETTILSESAINDR